MNQVLESQQTPHISPSRASYGVSIVRILEKIDRVVTAPHCSWFQRRPVTNIGHIRGRKLVSFRLHDDVIKWKHFPRYWSFVRGILHAVTGGSPSQKPVTRSFDVFFDLGLKKRFSKQSLRRWFQTPWRSLWRHGNIDIISLCQHPI